MPGLNGRALFFCDDACRHAVEWWYIGVALHVTGSTFGGRPSAKCRFWKNFCRLIFYAIDFFYLICNHNMHDCEVVRVCVAWHFADGFLQMVAAVVKCCAAYLWKII